MLLISSALINIWAPEIWNELFPLVNQPVSCAEAFTKCIRFIPLPVHTKLKLSLWWNLMLLSDVIWWCYLMVLSDDVIWWCYLMMLSDDVKFTLLTLLFWTLYKVCKWIENGICVEGSEWRSQSHMVYLTQLLASKTKI